MKKNITINLFGSLFAIDEDAYELLKKYEESLRAYFCKQEGGEEIADDIERRIAELFEELKTQGIEAISIEHVQDIIKRIGAPEQMTDNDNEGEKAGVAQNATKTTSKGISKKKLFRDPNDQMLGGVMSGLSHYFGGDVLLWRLLVIILCLLTSFTILLAYIAMWIIVPLARTPEDFLLMEGREVTPDNIAQTIMGYNDAANTCTTGRTGINSILGICMTIFKITLYLVGGFVVLAFAGCLVGLIVLTILALVGVISFGTVFATFTPFDENAFVFLPSYCSFSFWMLIIAGFICCIIPIYCLTHHFLRLRNKAKSMSTLQRCLWIIVWIISVGAVIASGTILIHGFANAFSNKREYILTKKKKHSPNNKVWEKCYQAFSGYNNTGAAVWVHDSDIEDYTYDELFSNLAPGIYRFSVRALCDTKGCYFYVERNGNKNGEQISYGTPRDIYTLAKSLKKKSGKGSKQEVNVALANAVVNCLPECIIDSIEIIQPTTIKCGIITSKELLYRDFDGSFIVHAPDFKVEKLETVNKHTVQSETETATKKKLKNSL